MHIHPYKAATQWLLTPTDCVNKSHHELLTLPNHVNLCTHFRVATSMVGARPPRVRVRVGLDSSEKG